ncbi:hypothetical protein BD311DRAFT_666434, partial [Dichomitus squalens]
MDAEPPRALSAEPPRPEGPAHEQATEQGEEQADDGPEFGNHDPTGVLPEPTLQELEDAIGFIKALKNASLDQSGLDPKIIHRMHHPEGDADLPDLLAPENDELRLALKQFVINGYSEKAYRDNRAAVMDYSKGLVLPTYEAMQNLVQELSGVVPIVTDMCPQTCVAYTGPYAHLDRCPDKDCTEMRYETRGNKRVARRTFQTHPLGPQLQALYRSRQCAKRM